MKQKLTHNDLVTMKYTAPPTRWRGASACVVGISDVEDRKDAFLEKFPTGTVYTIEFESGESITAHESWLETATAFKRKRIFFQLLLYFVVPILGVTLLLHAVGKISRTSIREVLVTPKLLLAALTAGAILCAIMFFIEKKRRRDETKKN